jgi:hypothetical protein
VAAAPILGGSYATVLFLLERRELTDEFRLLQSALAGASSSGPTPDPTPLPPEKRDNS